MVISSFVLLEHFGRNALTLLELFSTKFQQGWILPQSMDQQFLQLVVFFAAELVRKLGLW